MKAYKFNLINSLTLIILGLWGAYPYLPSGLVLATDKQEGLFI